MGVLADITVIWKGGGALSWVRDSIRAFLDRGDRLLLALCLLASGFGMVLIFSATRYMNTAAGLRCLLIQAVGILLGVAAYVLLSSVDIELFTEKSWKWLLAFGLFINLLLITPLGTGAEETGNNSWLSIPGFPVNLQPAELAKLTFVLLLAWQMKKMSEGGSISRPASVFSMAGHTLLMLGLIVATSGDFGMALTYAVIFVVVAWAGGVKKRWFLLAIVVCAAAVLLIWPRVSDLYFAKRITVLIDHILGNPETLAEQTRGIGFQQTRSILAIGSGGLFGMGYLNGTQTQSASESALPARHTDEIFAVCGEEFGLVGCVLLLCLLAAIILRCIWVARRAGSPQSALIAMGFAGMLTAQVAVNVGMCLYVFPVVGLTLPFISYGGTSIVTMYAAMGIVSGIKMRALPSWLRDRSRL